MDLFILYSNCQCLAGLLLLISELQTSSTKSKTIRALFCQSGHTGTMFEVPELCHHVGSAKQWTNTVSFFFSSWSHIKFNTLHISVSYNIELSRYANHLCCFFKTLLRQFTPSYLNDHYYLFFFFFQLNLVCGLGYQTTLAQSVLFAGTATGSLMFGFFSDRCVRIHYPECSELAFLLLFQLSALSLVCHACNFAQNKGHQFTEALFCATQ